MDINNSIRINDCKQCMCIILLELSPPLQNGSTKIIQKSSKSNYDRSLTMIEEIYQNIFIVATHYHSFIKLEKTYFSSFLSSGSMLPQQKCSAMLFFLGEN